jgi:NifU-like protein
MKQRFLSSFPWTRYSKKLASKIENPRSAGFFSKEEAASKNMRLAIGKEGTKSDGNVIALYLLVDESDGVIADARFQVFGDSALIGAAEAACELLLRKNVDQARRISAELIDKHLRDKSDRQAFPDESGGYINLVLAAIEEAVLQCLDIPLPETYVAPPMDFSQLSEGVYPDWETLSTKQKIAVIEQVIAEDIQPYIALDAGGVRILNLVNDKELIIAYEGSCTSCYSATGATLDAIQQILRAKVHPEIIVTPDLSFLTQSN